MSLVDSNSPIRCLGQVTLDGSDSDSHVGDVRRDSRYARTHVLFLCNYRLLSFFRYLPSQFVMLVVDSMLGLPSGLESKASLGSRTGSRAGDAAPACSVVDVANSVRAQLREFIGSGAAPTEFGSRL